MGRTKPGTYSRSWTPPSYTVDDDGKVLGGYRPLTPNNWGRWGELDVRGTANLTAAEHVVAAARLVRTGEVISLALPVTDSAPRYPERPPAKHYVTMSGSDAIVGSPFNAAVQGYVFADDAIDMNLQGTTQWDGLSHFMVEDTLYNGYWAGNISTLGGAQDTGIHHQRESFVGRGVLLDVARYRGVESMSPGEAIGPDLLDEVAAAEGVKVGVGDILLLRTGYLNRWWPLTDHQSKLEYFWGQPGLSHHAVPWLHAHDVAAVAADTLGVEVQPTEADAPRDAPLHHAALVDLGLTLGEFWDLERLSAACAADGRYEFLLVAPPLYIPGAVGSPLNPVAIR